MQKITNLYKICAGALLAFVHTAILVYWEQPGDHNSMWMNVTLLIFMFLPIATLIVLINRRGLSMALGLIYVLSFSIFAVGMAYVDRGLLYRMYFVVLSALWINDVIRRFMEVEQCHLNSAT